MRNTINRLLGPLLVMLLISPVYSQNVAVKSNLLYDVTTTFSMGVEVGLGNKWSIDLSGNYNAWAFSDNKKLKHWLVQPEIRYWICQKFNGHYFGFHLHGGEYNMGNLDIPVKFFGNNFKLLKDYRYEGWLVGGGMAYGYSWILSDRWNIEASLGFGYARLDFDKYDCPECGEWIASGTHSYWGPTKLSLSLIYKIK